jgi:hypothetical protein
MARLRALGTPAAQMAAGMMVFAASGYAFLVLAGRVLPKDQATLATSVYFLVNVVGPGIFFALEQVASRTTAAALATGFDLGAAAHRAYRSSLRLLLAVLAGLVALAPLLGAKTLHGDWPLYAVMLAMPAISVHLHLGRGRLAGMWQFGSYAATLAVEGGGRVLLCLAVAAVGAHSAVQFGLAYIVPSAVAAGVALPAAHTAARRAQAPSAAAPPPASEGPASAVVVNTTSTSMASAGGGDPNQGMTALAAAGLFSQLLPNIAALAVNSRLPSSSAAALAFSQAAVVARIPLLLFVPIQAMILPRLSAAAARGELAAVRAKACQVLPLTAKAGLAWALAFVLLGPQVLRTFFGTSEPVPRVVLLILALSTVMLMAAFTLQPALVALGGNAAVMAAWVVGSVVTGTVGLLPFSVVPAAAAGQLLGPTLTVALMGGALVVRLRRPPRPAPAGRTGRAATEPTAVLRG